MSEIGSRERFLMDLQRLLAKHQVTISCPVSVEPGDDNHFRFSGPSWSEGFTFADAERVGGTVMHPGNGSFPVDHHDSWGNISNDKFRENLWRREEYERETMKMKVIEDQARRKVMEESKK